MLERRRIGQGGPSIATLGFGTAPIGGLYDLLTEAAATQTVHAALRAGIDLIDTGPTLGNGLAEHRLGAALHSAATVPLIAARVGNLLRAPRLPETARRNDGGHSNDPLRFREQLSFSLTPDYRYDGLLRAFEDAQQRLARTKLDILIIDDPIHPDPEAALQDLLDGGFDALDALRSTGRISAIGCAISSPKLAERVVSATDLDLVLFPGTYTLLDQSAAPLLALCRARGLSVMVESPLHAGLLASRPSRAARHFPSPAPDAMIALARRIDAVCSAHGVPLAAAALQFPLLEPEVVCVLPGMGSPEEVAQNVALMRHPISNSMWDDLSSEGLIPATAPVPAL